MGIAALALLCHMTAAFLVSLARRDNGLADVAYGLGFIVASTAAFLRSGLAHPRQVLLLAMVAAWGLRLAIHILVRNWGREEDFRYRAWREAWGKTFVVRSFLQIYLLQGCRHPRRPRAGPPRDGRPRRAARLARRGGGPRLGRRAPVRGLRRPAAAAPPARPGAARPRAADRALALHAAPQLLRRGDPLVGRPARRARGAAGLGRRRRPAHDPLPAPQGVGDPDARGEVPRQPGVRGLPGAHERLLPLVPGQAGAGR